jgi:PKD repeat protein
VNGNIVPDGEYKMIIEFTDKHAQGPYYEVTFYKGTQAVSITPPNQQFIINMQLSYEPEITVAANFSAHITEACQEEDIIFTDNSTGATTWFWNFGDGSNPATATTQGPHTVTYSIPGDKTVSLTVNGSVTETKNGYISIIPTPSAGFTSTQIDNIVAFTNTSQNASSYFWNFGDGGTSSEVNPSHEYLENGEYTVTLTATSDQCGEDTFSDIVYIVGVGMIENEAEMLEIYPNPSSGTFSLLLPQKGNHYSIKLMDFRGNIVMKQSFVDPQINNSINFENLNLIPGIYLLEYYDGERYLTRKLIVK